MFPARLNKRSDLVSEGLKDTSEVLQDGDVPDVVVERVHGIVTAATEEGELAGVQCRGSLPCVLLRRTCSVLEEL